ncbi:hypothetical protein BGW36DRAFT_307891 [Talaromyces proteolyticus]|uniref:MmgE/PrpD family protein n=1 Tax=Talaromyces proteolyticus TaxID=1131652 RepID=A0AAD4KDP9_9EURO|nr:uncharacterized protein BGW36DRAFT_307891 [Talaromyces proteolyticus]KAH8689362.1 hypothetical protein BGW36DRAFT_307891 [Talaromyces proteolyticus]
MASEDRGDNNLTPQRSEEPPDCLTQDSRPTTSVIAEFVQNTKYADLDESVKMTVKNLILDYIGVACAAVDKAESTEPVYRAISCLQASDGRNTVFKKGQKFLPQYAALLNGFLAHSLDFDDTYAEGVLHAGVTAITAGLVASEVLGTRGDALIEAVAIGYEVTCRIGRALGHGAYSRGFHNTSTAGIFGAVATISKVKGLSTSLIEMAFGLAGSKPAGSMQYLENGSWNKRLHPGFAVHDAWLCVSLAESGVIGAEKIFEGKFGFFNAYTPNKINYEELLDTLGSEWVFLKTIWKPFPACRMTHGLIEVVDEIRRKFSSSSSAKEVKHIHVRLPSYQYPIVGLPTPNKVHPLNIVDAQFSAYYQIALSWLHGGYIGWAGYDYLRDSSIHKLAECIHIMDDPGLDRLEQYITLEFTDGTVVTKHIKPKDDGGAGDSSREKIAAKYLGLAGPVFGEEAARKIQNIVYTLERYHVSELMALVQ